MKPLDVQYEFIRRRANKESYRRISEALGISKSTCSDWDSQYREEIAMQRQDMLNDLYEDYGMTKQARIASLGQTVKRIDQALASVDFSKVPPEKLLDMKLKYTTAMKAEYTGTVEPLPLPADRGDATNTYYAAADLYDRLREGEITPQQAKTELSAITTMASTHESASNPFAQIPFAALAKALKLSYMLDDEDEDDGAEDYGDDDAGDEYDD